MSIDPITLDKWQAVCDAATVGPWINEARINSAHYNEISAPSYGEVATTSFDDDYPQQSFKDAAFIALARTALPLAIAALRERAWRPITEAPTNCTCVLVPDGESSTLAFYSNLRGVWLDCDAEEMEPQPTVFQLLPPAPAQQQEGEG